jgi:hypothetical protein
MKRRRGRKKRKKQKKEKSREDRCRNEKGRNIDTNIEMAKSNKSSDTKIKRMF